LRGDAETRRLVFSPSCTGLLVYRRLRENVLSRRRRACFSASCTGSPVRRRLRGDTAPSVQLLVYGPARMPASPRRRAPDVRPFVYWRSYADVSAETPR